MEYSSVKLYNSEKYLEDYIIQLQDNIRELRTSYEELVNRVEQYLLKITGNDEKQLLEYKAETEKPFLFH